MYQHIGRASSINGVVVSCRTTLLNSKAAAVLRMKDFGFIRKNVGFELKQVTNIPDKKSTLSIHSLF